MPMLLKMQTTFGQKFFSILMDSFVHFLLINKIQQDNRTKEREHNGFASHLKV